MRSLTTIIVDDEPLALKGLQHRLAGFKDVNIVRECKTY